MRSAAIACFLSVFLTTKVSAQNYPDLSGMWYQNGNISYPAYIIQNGTETLWAVTLTDCCCTCNAAGTTCGTECDTWCKQQGKNGGKFTGICLLGVVSGGTHPDCQCW